MAHAPHRPLTVDWLLQHPLLEGATVSTGEVGLYREVVWCLPMAELPQAEGAGAADLTGLAVHVSPPPGDDRSLGQGHRRMDVAHLAARDPAVVLVDTSVDPGPDLALKGGAAGIPVVSLPPGVSFHQLNMLVAEHNLAQKAHVTEYGIMVHESLSRILYTGAGLRAMARQISVISRRPVLVTDVHFAVLAHSQSSTGSSRSLATRDLADAMDRATVDIHLSADPGAGHAQASLRRLAVGSTSLWAVLAPILFGGTVYGWVAVIGDKDEPGAHDLAQHLVAVTQGAIVVGAEMLRIRSMREAEERARGDFIDALLHSRFADARELAARAASQGFDLDATYGVAIAQGGAPVGATGGVERSISLQRNIEALLPRRDPPGWVTAVGRNLVAVVPVIHRGGQGGASRFAQEMLDALAKRSGDPWLVTFGREYPGAEGVARSYREARLALGLASLAPTRGPVQGYGDLRVYAALAALAHSPEGVGFSDELLGPLRSHDGLHEGNLTEVVLAYVAAGGSLTAASRRLELHRNTLLYKLKHASNLLHMDLRDPESLFMLWLADRVATLSRLEGALDRELHPEGPGRRFTAPLAET